jgi:hypothetical protein
MSDRELLPRIFISYRREDTGGWAGRVADCLIAIFGKTNIFFDVDTINPGSNFVQALNVRAANCDVLLAVIGKDWLHAEDLNGRRRLDNPQDFVRVEIAAALKRQIRIIPVLVSGTRMPQSNELPADLADLAEREAVEIGDNGFHSTMERLIPILIREGKRRHAVAKPAGPVLRKKPPRTPTHVFSFEPRRIARWFRAHRLISGMLFLLALLTFSPIWYRPRSSVSLASSQVAENPAAADALGRSEPVTAPAKPQAAAPVPSSGPETILHDFKTVHIVTHGEQFFNDEDVRRELQTQPDFAALKMEIVDDPSAADIVLEVNHVFPGDFPFEVKSRKTGEVLLSSEGTGPLRGKAGAESIAGEFVRAVKPFRATL